MTRLTQKELILTALVGLLSAAFHGGFAWLLKIPVPTWLWYAVTLLGIMSISLLMITIALIQHRALRWLASFIPPFAVAAFGWAQPGAIAGASLLAITTLIASITTRDHLDDYVKLQPRRAFWTGSQLVVIGTVAALAGLYFPVLVNQLQTGSVQLDERSVEPFLLPIIPVVASLIPGYQNEQSLPPTTTTLVTNLLNQQLGRFTTESPLLVSLLILIPVFFTTWFLSPALLWPVILGITGLLWIFRRLQLVRIESHPEPVDHLTLS